MVAPATVVFGYAAGVISFDSVTGYGGADGGVRLKLVIPDDRKEALVFLSVTDATDTPTKYRTLRIPLKKCLEITHDHGLLFDAYDRPTAGVLGHYQENLGFELPSAQYEGNFAHAERGKRAFYGHREKQYHYLDLRIQGIPEDLEWKGTPLDEMSEECQAIIADYENCRDLDLLVMEEHRKGFRDLDTFLRICDEIQERIDHVLKNNVPGAAASPRPERAPCHEAGIQGPNCERNLSEKVELSGKLYKDIDYVLTEGLATVWGIEDKKESSNAVITDKMAAATAKIVEALRELKIAVEEA